MILLLLLLLLLLLFVLRLEYKIFIRPSHLFPNCHIQEIIRDSFLNWWAGYLERKVVRPGNLLIYIYIYIYISD
jgi:hypothetical protein